MGKPMKVLPKIEKEETPQKTTALLDSIAPTSLAAEFLQDIEEEHISIKKENSLSEEELNAELKRILTELLISVTDSMVFQMAKQILKEFKKKRPISSMEREAKETKVTIQDAKALSGLIEYDSDSTEEKESSYGSEKKATQIEKKYPRTTEVEKVSNEINAITQSNEAYSGRKEELSTSKNPSKDGNQRSKEAYTLHHHHHHHYHHHRSKYRRSSSFSSSSSRSPSKSPPSKYHRRNN